MNSFKKGDYIICINGNSNNAKEGSIARVASDNIKTSGITFSLLHPSVDIIWIKIVPEGASQNNGEYYADYFKLATKEELLTAGIYTESVLLIFN